MQRPEFSLLHHHLDIGPDPVHSPALKRYSADPEKRNHVWASAGEHNGWENQFAKLAHGLTPDPDNPIRPQWKAEDLDTAESRIRTTNEELPPELQQPHPQRITEQVIDLDYYRQHGGTIGRSVYFLKPENDAV